MVLGPFQKSPVQKHFRVFFFCFPRNPEGIKYPDVHVEYHVENVPVHPGILYFPGILYPPGFSRNKSPKHPEALLHWPTFEEAQGPLKEYQKTLKNPIGIHSASAALKLKDFFSRSTRKRFASWKLIRLGTSTWFDPL